MLVVNDHMTEKENIKSALEVIESYLIAEGGDDVIENWDGHTPRTLLTEIKKVTIVTIVTFIFTNSLFWIVHPE